MVERCLPRIALRRSRSKDRSARIQSPLGMWAVTATEQTALGVGEIGDVRRSNGWRQRSETCGVNNHLASW
jgi:hypothetical protein